ncbi:MAG TPA: hypothetical protein VNW98_04170 [Burkholderiaceae bacterium]|nr:hypothetical protein [Burkholderiaceae bacterium]
MVQVVFVKSSVNWLGRHWRQWLAGLALIGVILFAVSYSPGSWMARRQADEHETVLYYFAQNVGEPALCDRISWAAYQKYSVWFGGGGASYFRSDCYERVAQSRHDASICWRVRPLVDLDPLWSGYSALSCRARTRARYSTGIALTDEQLIRIFQRMGYDIDAMPVDGLMQPAIRLRDVYYGLERNPAAVARAKQLLTSPDQRLPSADRSFVAQLAAVISNDPHWCEQIPPGAPTDPPAPPSRDGRYLAVAYNTQDVRLCEKMTPAALEPAVQAAEAHGIRAQIAEQMGLHGECLRIATRLGPAPHYGPPVPDRDEQTQRLLTALQVEVPRARDWSTNQQSIYYRDFLFALWPKPRPDPSRPARDPADRQAAEEVRNDAARDRERTALVARLLALPAQP